MGVNLDKRAAIGLKSVTWATFTQVRFRFKTHIFCYGYACRLHYSSVFDPLKLRLSKTKDPVLVWKLWVAFQCKRTKMETFEKDDVAAHICTAYP